MDTTDKCIKLNNSTHKIFYKNTDSATRDSATRDSKSQESTLTSVRKIRLDTTAVQNLFHESFMTHIPYVATIRKKQNISTLRIPSKVLYIESNSYEEDRKYIGNDSSATDNFYVKLIEYINQNWRDVYAPNGKTHLADSIGDIPLDRIYVQQYQISDDELYLFLALPNVEDYYNAKFSYADDKPITPIANLRDKIIERNIKNILDNYLQPKGDREDHIDNKEDHIDFINNKEDLEKKIRDRLKDTYTKWENTSRDSIKYHLFVWKIMGDNIVTPRSFRELTGEYIKPIKYIQQDFNLWLQESYNITLPENIIYYIKYPTYYVYTDFAITVEYVSPYFNERRHVYKNNRYILLSDIIYNLENNYTYHDYKLTFYLEPKFIPVRTKKELINKGFKILSRLLKDIPESSIQLHTFADCIYDEVRDRIKKIRLSDNKIIPVSDMSKIRLLKFNLSLCKKVFLDHLNKPFSNTHFVNDKISFVNKIINLVKPYDKFIDKLSTISDIDLQYKFLSDNAFNYYLAYRGIIILIDIIGASYQPSILHSYSNYPTMKEIRNLSGQSGQPNQSLKNKDIPCEDTQSDYYNSVSTKNYDTESLMSSYIIYLIYRKTFDTKLLSKPDLLKTLSKICNSVLRRLEYYLRTHLEMTSLIRYISYDKASNVILKKLFFTRDYMIFFYLYDSFKQNDYKKVDSVINMLLLSEYAVMKVMYRNAYDTEFHVWGSFCPKFLHKVIITYKPIDIDGDVIKQYFETTQTLNLVGNTNKFMINHLIKSYLYMDCQIDTDNPISFDNLYMHDILFDLIQIYGKDCEWDDNLRKYFINYVSPTVEPWLINLLNIRSQSDQTTTLERNILKVDEFRDKFYWCTSAFAVFPDIKWEVINYSVQIQYEKLSQDLLKYRNRFSNPYFISYYMTPSIRSNSLCGADRIIPHTYKDLKYKNTIKDITFDDLVSIKELYVANIIKMWKGFNVSIDELHSVAHYMADMKTGTFHLHFITLNKENIYTGSQYLDFHKLETYHKQFRCIKTTDIINNLEIAQKNNNVNYYNKYQGCALTFPRFYEMMDLIRDHIPNKNLS